MPTEAQDQVLVPIGEPLSRRPAGKLLSAVRRPLWIDALVLLTLALLVYFTFRVTRTLAAPPRHLVVINLSPWLLPKYVGWSVFRNFAAFGLSFAFTFIYGYIAGKSRRAHTIMIPILDIFQSVPVLAFMPSTLLAVMALFPHSNFGLELVSIILIFTGQAWNMCFSFYHSLRSIPDELKATARVYGFGWWRRLWKLELPFAAIPLVWNAKMSMAGGWFFLTVIEAIKLGDQSFLLPGIGSYMSVANAQKNYSAMLYGILAMAITIVLLDQLFWNPIIAWSRKFKYEETADSETADSLILDLVRRSAILDRLGRLSRWISETGLARGMGAARTVRSGSNGSSRIGRFLVLVLISLGLGLGLFGLYVMVRFFMAVSLDRWTHDLDHFARHTPWRRVAEATGLTFMRVLATLVFSSLWAVPFGILVGLKPRLSQKLQPVIQTIASFPAPMIYPLIAVFLMKLGISFEIGSIVLFIIGTQWYMLFNATAGASAVPFELVEAARSYRFRRWRVWWRVYLPAALPYLVTGWITTAGGAWNASIVAEYVYLGNRPLAATGLGAMITQSTESRQLALLSACVLVMIFVVVAVNRLFWEPLFRYASENYGLGK